MRTQIHQYTYTDTHTQIRSASLSLTLSPHGPGWNLTSLTIVESSTSICMNSAGPKSRTHVARAILNSKERWRNESNRYIFEPKCVGVCHGTCVRVCICRKERERVCVRTYVCLYINMSKIADNEISRFKREKERKKVIHQPQQCTNVWIRLSLRRPQIASSKRQPITSVASHGSTDSCRVFIPCVWELATFNLKRQS